ncbi:MAG: fructose-1,6-bisphosphatase [Defluviitaleaceae bacterium]|nr:fructose-1,6-bisphosphatase [Defluviitaleaceae bacterium]MCL2836047.1 fructose-1,6-bisphosphatase [Defluviitaleaceae bacterium]
MKKEIRLAKEKLSFLELLSEQYPNHNAACTEIINLSAILNLPKGTEHFVSDIHGEYEAFHHVMRNASGVIWEYIEELYGASIRENEKRQLALLICYPVRLLEKVRGSESNMSDFYRVMLLRMVRVCKRASSKYTRSKVRKAMPAEYEYILEELIHEDADRLHKHEYYNQIIDRIIGLGRAEAVIEKLAALILRLAVDHLHVIGDIYDRGPAAHLIMDDLCVYHSVDVQWGNHDINWMGAASGSFACICNVIRIAAKYNNLHTLEEGYGINLVPLAAFAMEAYKDDPCKCFALSDAEQSGVRDKDALLIARMHKAVTVLQFKAEAEIIRRNPGFGMDGRLLLHKINFIENTVEIDGVTYPLLDNSFPTVCVTDPYALTPDESNVLAKLRQSFLNCEKLQRHVRFLFNKGGMYKVYNGNLLFHGGIPMNPDGTLREVDFGGIPMHGRELFDAIDKACRQGYALRERDLSKTKTRGLDIMWYLWCGADSPLYGKDKMATFERYFIADESTRKESRDPYFILRNKRDVCVRILENFKLTHEDACIINGHVPVEIKKGENPVKAEGKLLNIDGGFAKAYQNVTGMAGYTLTYNSRGMALTAHKPFTSPGEIIRDESLDFSPREHINYNEKRIIVADTDGGKAILNKIESLQMLVQAYDEGLVKEEY